MDGWSSVFRFHTFPYGTDWSPRLCIYGDLGNTNAKSLGYIQEEMTRDDFDAILHVGESNIVLYVLYMLVSIIKFSHNCM